MAVAQTQAQNQTPFMKVNVRYVKGYSPLDRFLELITIAYESVPGNEKYVSVFKIPSNGARPPFTIVSILTDAKPEELDAGKIEALIAEKLSRAGFSPKVLNKVTIKEATATEGAETKNGN